MRVYVGYEAREARSFKLAMASAKQRGFDPLPLYEDRLRTSGLLTRSTDRRANQMWDFNSDAPQSTSFAIARFFTPLLAHSGWCLFVDCDVVFLRSAAELAALADPKYAVMVVKHQLGETTGLKMDGQVQTTYPRKLWSSVILWNIDHPANRRVNQQMLNQWPGRDLHAFGWLAGDEIGELPGDWNWLVGMQPLPARPAIAHYTLGTPELLPYSDHADLWYNAAKECGV